MSVIFVAILIAGVFEAVTAKTCYSTDLDSLRKGDFSALNASPQDCQTYLTKTMRAQGVATYLPDYLQYSCYTLSVDIDQPVGGIKIVGCIPEGGCSVMKNAFLSTIKHKGGAAATHIHGAECTECSTNECNVIKKREYRSIVQKMYSSEAIQQAADITLAATATIV